jgi:hypothetical protein
MASSLRQLPANYTTRSAFNFGRKRWMQTLLKLSGFVAWLVCSGLLLWIAVRLHPDPQKDMPVFGQAEGLVGSIVVLIFLFGVATILHQALHGGGYWLVTRERPRFVLSRRNPTVSATGWYLSGFLYSVILLAPLVIWLPITIAANALVPAPTVYWVAVALALHISLCTGDVVMMAWILRQPRQTLFGDNDGDMGTTAYAPTI